MKRFIFACMLMMLSTIAFSQNTYSTNTEGNLSIFLMNIPISQADSTYDGISIMLELKLARYVDWEVETAKSKLPSSLSMLMDYKNKKVVLCPTLSPRMKTDALSISLYNLLEYAQARKLLLNSIDEYYNSLY